MARWLLPLTCAFGCPLLMGVMMWGLGRDAERRKLEREVRRLNRLAGVALPERQPVVGGLGGALRRVWCSACLNWKVVAAVTAVGLGLAVASPRLFASAGPGLLLLVCPASMLITMIAMGRSRRTTPAVSTEPQLSNAADLPADDSTAEVEVAEAARVDRSAVSS